MPAPMTVLSMSARMAGQSWRRKDAFKGVPDMTLVEDIIASRHDANVAYAVFDNHKRGGPQALRNEDDGPWQ